MRAPRLLAAALTTFALTFAPAVAMPHAAAAQEISTDPLVTTAPDTPRTQDGDPFLTLSVDTVAPSTVTTSSDSFVTVRATVTNTGDRRVEDIGVRMQGAEAVDSTAGLRTSLTLDQDRFDSVGEFVTVAESLERDESRQFDISMQLRDTAGPSLNITAPGVYPLLLNVNGTPEYGAAARLDDARFLLPVVGVPRGLGDASTDTDPIAPDISDPVDVTVLWPLADRPRLAAGIPGSNDERVRLVDDELATELADGGRLDTLLGAVEFATESGVDPDGRLASSMCLAIDPDLLVTVSNMTRGYLVVEDPTDPTGPAREGAGSAQATQWMSRLQAVASDLCTTALPFAQTDLGAVADIDDASLLNSAVGTTSDIVDGILGVTSVRDFLWSPSGGLDDSTAAALRTIGPNTTLVADNSVEPPVGPGRAPSVGNTPGSPNSIDTTVFDSATATALAAVGPDPSTPAYTPVDQRFDLGQNSRTARLQDALGAISYHALAPPQAFGVGSTNRAVTIAPPQYWTASGDEPSAILSAVSSQLRSGLATPRGLEDVLAAPATGPPVATVDTATELDADTVDRVRELSARIDTLTQSLVDDPQAASTPRGFTAPLREDMLRALTTAGQDGGSNVVAGDDARTRLDATGVGIDAIYRAVTVLAPGGVYTLASEQSPLLLVARNDLPIAVNVLLDVDAPPEMTISDVGVTQLPARGSRTITVPAEVNDTRNLSVDFSLTTLDGSRLGDVSTVSVRSNAYGQALAIITACAGGLLLLLAGRRLWHRFKGQPDPADEGYERP